MRFLMIAAAAALLMLPATAPAKACGAGPCIPPKLSPPTYLPPKKTAEDDKKKEKVEYMRAAPMK